MMGQDALHFLLDSPEERAEAQRAGACLRWQNQQQRQEEEPGQFLEKITRQSSLKWRGSFPL